MVFEMNRVLGLSTCLRLQQGVGDEGHVLLVHVRFPGRGTRARLENCPFGNEAG